MSSEPPSRQKTELSHEKLVRLFRIDFKSQLSKESLNLLVDFFDSQEEFELNPQEYGNSTNDKGNELCTILSKQGFINSMENITTKFRNLLAKVNEDDRFDGLIFLYQWLEQWIATPGFRSKNKSELAANVESKLFILMEKDLKKVKEDNIFIIHPLCTDRVNEPKGDNLVLERVLEFLNQSKKKVLLILGNAGSGKSTCCQMILRLLWAKYNSTEIGEGEIPLFASLPKIRDPTSIVSEIFESAGISNADQQTWLKEHRIAHFILDGYDELYSPVNLFFKTKLGTFNGKIIISCRTESLPDLNLLSPQNSEIMKIYLTPWTETQIDEYIIHQSTDNNSANFHKLIESIPSLKEFIQTPFHLKIITEILPEIKKRMNDNRNMNRYEIYDLFVRNRINQAIQNRAPLDHLQTMKLTSPQLPDAVIRQCIKWSIYMRNQKSTTLSFNMTKSKIVKQLRSLAGLETKEQILRWLSPLLIEEDGDIVNCRFIHATIGEFFLVFQLNQILSETKSTPEKQLKKIKKHPIFTELLEISTWKFISDLIKSNEQLKTEIWNLIELSKKSEEFSILAANCASIWNIAGFSFSGKKLRNIKIPGAYLNRAIFYGADLRNANLKGCKLKDSILSEANLEGADLRDAKFGEMAPWKLEHDCSSAMIYENQFIAFNSKTEEVEIWNLSTRKLDFSWKLEYSGEPMKLINGTILMFVSYDNRRIRFLDLKSGKLLFKHIGAFDKIEFNADESLMCSWNDKDRKLTLWDLKTFKPLWTTEYDAQNIKSYRIHLQFSLDNRHLLISDYQNVIIFNVSTGKLLHQFQSLVEFEDCSFSSDGENIIGISTNRLLCWHLKSKSHRSKKFDEFSWFLRLWNIPNQDEVLILDESGILIFLNFESFTIAKFLTMVKVISLAADGFNCLFSQDGTLFAFRSIDGMFHLVDSKQRTLLHSVVIHHFDFRSKILSFSRNSIYLLQNYRLIRNYLWDSEESINTLERNLTLEVDSLHLTNDSTLISQQFLTIYARNCDSGQLQFTHYFNRSTFHHDVLSSGSCWCGHFFVTCSKNLEVSFWKVGNRSMSLHHKLALKIPNFPKADSIKCSSNDEVVVITISFLRRGTSALFMINIYPFRMSLHSFFEFTPNKKIFVTKEMIVWNLHSNFWTLDGQEHSSTARFEWAKESEIQLATDFEILVSKGHSIQLLDILTGFVMLELKSSFSNPMIFSLCKRERFLVIGDEVGWLEIWDLSDQTIKTTIQVNERATAICASNDFSQLFIGTSKGSIWHFKLSKIESSNPEIELIWVHKPALLATNANLKETLISEYNQALFKFHRFNEKSETGNAKISEEEKAKRKEIWNERQILKSKRKEMSTEEVKTQLLKLQQMNQEIKEKQTEHN